MLVTIPAGAEENRLALSLGRAISLEPGIKREWGAGEATYLEAQGQWQVFGSGHLEGRIEAKAPPDRRQDQFFGWLDLSTTSPFTPLVGIEYHATPNWWQVSWYAGLRVETTSPRFQGKLIAAGDFSRQQTLIAGHWSYRINDEIKFTGWGRYYLPSRNGLLHLRLVKNMDSEELDGFVGIQLQKGKGPWLFLGLTDRFRGEF